MVTFIEVIGYIAIALFALFIIYKLVARVFFKILYPYVLASQKDLKKLAGGDWAVVTGATDGIGKAYAKQLAKMKFNVLLISRTQSKLDATKIEVERVSMLSEVRTFAIDFSSADKKAYDPLIKLLNDLEVGVLVNNVGMGVEYPDYMHLTQGGAHYLGDMTTCNTLPIVMLSTAVLPKMVARHEGIIINISSGAAMYKLPFWNVYSSTKRFVSHLSGIMRQEYSPHGITVQTIEPGLVQTKMAMDGLVSSPFFGPDPDTFVKSALRTVGHDDDTAGCIGHQIQAEFSTLLPEWLIQKIIAAQAPKVKQAQLKRRTTSTTS